MISLENRLEDNIQHVGQGVKKLNREERNEEWSERSNKSFFIGVRNKSRANRTEMIFEEIMADNISEQLKDTDL